MILAVITIVLSLCNLGFGLNENIQPLPYIDQ